MSVIMVMDSLYYASAEVIRQAFTKEKCVRGAVYGNPFKNKKQLLRISCETLKNRAYFDRILAHPALRHLLKEPAYKHFSIIHVLLYEYLFGNGLRKCSKKLSAPIFAVKDIISQQADEQKGVSSFSSVIPSSNKEAVLPKYGRINALKWTLKEAVQALSNDGWSVQEMCVKEGFDAYKNLIRNMKNNEIFLDPHVHNLVVFPPVADLHDSWMIKQGYIILQDKASCLSAFLLNPRPGCDVIDVCAAPGMKTSHLAALMKNKGHIWALDKAPDRVETLRSIMEKAGVTNVSVHCEDCLRLNINDKRFCRVRYALVDPPCSGSGIVKRLDSFVNDADSFSQSRLRSLANLQAMILKHVLKFPGLKRVVYSTCSIYMEENEEVIQEVLNDESLGKKYKLIHALPTWKLRGSAKFPFGEKCVKATFEDTVTNGFFIAVLQRRKNRE